MEVVFTTTIMTGSGGIDERGKTRTCGDTDRENTDRGGLRINRGDLVTNVASLVSKGERGQRDDDGDGDGFKNCRPVPPRRYKLNSIIAYNWSNWT